MKKVQLFESFISEGFEVHYSDGVRAAKKFKSEKDAMSFTKDKIASGKCKEIAIYKDGSGFNSTADTEAVVAWWGDGSYLDNVSKKDSKLAAKKIDESLIVEGQFSWMTQDTDTQIGSERENTITVYMFSDKGERWEEKRYEGYGEFGGKDYYELLAQMNGVENGDRQDGIDIAFGKTKTKGKTLFPALVQDAKYNWKRHDFTVQPDNDPNQSWYQEPEEDDDDYDEYDESKVTEAKALPLDKLTKMIGDKPSCYSLADFVYTNYDKVTGLKKSMRNDEMDFPSEIMDLVDHYGFDVDDFTDKYSMAAESVVIEATSYDPDDIFFLWDDYVDNGREGIERGHTGSGSNKHELFTFDTEVDGYDKFETELKKLLKKSGWKNEYNQDTLKVYESRINEALSKEQKMVETFLNKIAKEFDYSIQDAVRFVKETISKMGLDEAKVNEASMSDIDLMAQEAKDFKSFVKEFTKEYHDLSNAGEPGQFKEWLQSVYDNAKANMDESVVTEGKHWHVLSGNTWYTGSDFSTNPADAMKYADIMSATKVAKKVGGMVHVMTDEEMTKAIKKFGKNESVVTEAKDVKSEVIDKLSQFFGVSTGALIKFNFDGKDDIRALTKALNGTDYEGVDNIVRVAVKAAKRDLGVDEAIKPAGLSKAETKKVAETYAKAIGKNDGVKCTVNLKSLEEDSFDLDIDGEEYAGGSYIITLDGDVVNAALPEKPVYGQIDSTVDQIIKNLKK
jgi:hypothetical protein